MPKAAARVAILVMMSAMIEEASRRAWEGIVDNYDEDDEEAGFDVHGKMLGRTPVFVSPHFGKPAVHF